jgi:hypothetical protein
VPPQKSNDSSAGGSMRGSRACISGNSSIP